MSAEKSNDLKVASLEEAPEKATIDQTISQAVLSDEQQKILRRKFDKRVLPIVCLLYLFSYLDRSNIGNAKTAGAQKDLGLSSSQVSSVNSADLWKRNLTSVPVGMGFELSIHCL
jgi:hypothetical protein